MRPSSRASRVAVGLGGAFGDVREVALERKILYLYYGLEEGSEAMTLEKIGALMGVTRERIRQIRERAFEKLRESPDGKALCGFWAA